MTIKGVKKIAKPRDEVVSYFADPAYLSEYQDGFIKKELISGESGKTGAVSKMYYKHGKREMVLTETIVANELPEFFEANYYHKHMDNSMKCNFIELDNTNTMYEYQIEYTRINWIVPKLIALIYPAIYRKQIEKWMTQFKAFVEEK